MGPGCATPSAAVPGDGPENPIVDDLTIEGARQVTPAELKKRILTTASSFQGVPFIGSTERFDSTTWQADLRRIERLYQARGYYQARVDKDDVVPASPGHVRLQVTVVEGDPTRLSSVALKGIEALPAEQRARVLAGLPLASGAVFQEAAWEDEKALLLQRLREEGYAEAAVQGEVQVDVVSHRALASLEVSPKERYRFGKVVVATDPNAKVPASRIIEQVKEVIVPGRWYTETALAEAQSRVFQMGVFAAVKVNRGAPDRGDHSVPVVVDVREAPFHTRRTGVGIGLEQTRQEVRVSGEYTDRNFFGGLRRYTLRGKVGYAFLPDVLSAARNAPGSNSNVIANLVNELEQPRFLRPDLSLQGSLELQSGIEPAYDYRGGALRVGVPWRPRRDFVVFPSYNLDLYFLSSPAPLNGRSPDVLFGCPSPCIVSYLEQTVELDRRDDRAEPHRGYYGALSLQEGGGPLGGAFSYLKLQPDLRGYASIGANDRATFAARLKLGTLLTRSGSSPIVSRFFSGGGDMRGFNTRRLSPMLAVASSTVPNGDGAVPGETLPIGGNGLFEASAEVRVRLFDDVILALFVDSGFVTAEELSLTSASYYSRNLFVAAGFGFRYLTAFGPIRVDLARRLLLGPPLPVDQPADATVAYPASGECFGLGSSRPGYAGSPEGVCAFHLSIGEAF